MSHCHDEGHLRAYLDAELPAGQRDALAGHLALCAACRTRLDDLRSNAERTRRLLGPPAATNPRAALARLGTELISDARPEAAHKPAGPAPARPPRRDNAMTNRRTMVTGIAAAALALSLLALPPVRAAADQLLQIFRVQNVVFVPVSQERIEELRKLNVEGERLFVAEPELVQGDEQPAQVESPAAAASALGAPLAQPSALPSQPLSTTLQVAGARSYTFQVDVESARELLKATGVNDVTLPDALGAQPISADVPATAFASYAGKDYEVRLIQGRSPQINLPDGVELSQLGKAALRVLGLNSAQAEQMSQKIDWNSTLLFPFPANVSNVRQVKVGGADGMLVQEGRGSSNQRFALYWQRGEQFFVMQTSGLEVAGVLAAAESVR